jgi:hypothetical protein
MIAVARARLRRKHNAHRSRRSRLTTTFLAIALDVKGTPPIRHLLAAWTEAGDASQIPRSRVQTGWRVSRPGSQGHGVTFTKRHRASLSLFVTAAVEFDNSAGCHRLPVAKTCALPSAVLYSLLLLDLRTSVHRHGVVHFSREGSPERRASDDLYPPIRRR